MWQILLAKLTKKMYLEGLISPIKKPQMLYCKIETPGVSLQITQTPWDDYTI